MVARQLKSQIEFRFPDYGTDRDDNCFANYLDPVLKGLHLKAVNKFEETLIKLEHLVDKPEENNNDNQPEFPTEEAPATALTPREKLKMKILAKEVSSQSSSGSPRFLSLRKNVPVMSPCQMQTAQLTD